MTTALVTGAGRGIGRAIAQRLGADGARVVCVGTQAAALEETAASLPDAEAVCCDLRDREAVEQLGRTVGALDVLVSNSGVAGPVAPLWEVDPDAWDDTLAVNLTGAFLLCRALMPDMLERGRGSVVLVGSVTAHRPLPGRVAYGASKSALIGLVRTLALDAGQFGVRVNMVSPGAVAGERFDAVVDAQSERREVAPERVRAEFLAQSPLRRLTDPEDVADAVAYLAGERAAGVTGAELTVASGGLMR